MAKQRMSLVGSHGTEAISSTAVEVDKAAGSEGVLLQAIDADVRFTLDGTAPVGATTGFLLRNGDMAVLVPLGDNCDTLTFIRDASTDAELQYQFVREFD